ncbi:iron-containing alcohol dehydrogenase [Sneathiella sp.]|uniref:iron-containing alcohol dehydrogenase n=1 Tax=Sneathiella sp. TaxID=1964365 RepID=UPI0035616B23
MTETAFPDMTEIQKRLVIERDAPEAIAQIITSEPNPRIFVSISRSLAKNSPITKDLQSRLRTKIVGVGSILREHTPYDKVFELAREISRLKATHLLSIGGGSVIDGGKIALLVANLKIKDAEELEAINYGSGKDLGITSWPIQHIAVPTTLSGAEFTPIAGATSSITGRKTGFAHTALVPDYIVLSSALSKYTPERLWLSTGIRAVDHAVETICVPGVDIESADFCAKGLKMLYQGMTATRQNPEDLPPRETSQLGVYYATAGISRYRMGASHGLGYLLGVIGHVPHGITSCVFLPAVVTYNLPETKEAQQQIAKVLDLQTAEEVGPALRDFIGRLGLPNRLSALDISTETLDEIKSGALTHPVVQANPKPIKTIEDVTQIFNFSG